MPRKRQINVTLFSCKLHKFQFAKKANRILITLFFGQLKQCYQRVKKILKV